MPTTRGGRGSRNKNRNNGRGGGKGSNSGNGKKRNSPPDSQSNHADHQNSSSNDNDNSENPNSQNSNSTISSNLSSGGIAGGGGGANQQPSQATSKSSGGGGGANQHPSQATSQSSNSTNSNSTNSKTSNSTDSKSNNSTNSNSPNTPTKKIIFATPNTNNPPTNPPTNSTSSLPTNSPSSRNSFAAASTMSQTDGEQQEDRLEFAYNVYLRHFKTNGRCLFAITFDDDNRINAVYPDLSEKAWNERNPGVPFPQHMNDLNNISICSPSGFIPLILLPIILSSDHLRDVFADAIKKIFPKRTCKDAHEYSISGKEAELLVTGHFTGVVQTPHPSMEHTVSPKEGATAAQHREINVLGRSMHNTINLTQTLNSGNAKSNTTSAGVPQQVHSQQLINQKIEEDFAAISKALDPNRSHWRDSDKKASKVSASQIEYICAKLDAILPLVSELSSKEIFHLTAGAIASYGSNLTLDTFSNIYQLSGHKQSSNSSLCPTDLNQAMRSEDRSGASRTFNYDFKDDQSKQRMDALLYDRFSVLGQDTDMQSVQRHIYPAGHAFEFLQPAQIYIATIVDMFFPSITNHTPDNLTSELNTLRRIAHFDKLIYKQIRELIKHLWKNDANMLEMFEARMTAFESRDAGHGFLAGLRPQCLLEPYVLTLLRLDSGQNSRTFLGSSANCLVQATDILTDQMVAALSNADELLSEMTKQSVFNAAGQTPQSFMRNLNLIAEHVKQSAAAIPELGPHPYLADDVYESWIINRAITELMRTFARMKTPNDYKKKLKRFYTAVVQFLTFRRRQIDNLYTADMTFEKLNETEKKNLSKFKDYEWKKGVTLARCFGSYAKFMNFANHYLTEMQPLQKKNAPPVPTETEFKKSLDDVASQSLVLHTRTVNKDEEKQKETTLSKSRRNRNSNSEASDAPRAKFIDSGNELANKCAKAFHYLHQLFGKTKHLRKNSIERETNYVPHLREFGLYFDQKAALEQHVKLPNSLHDVIDFKQKTIVPEYVPFVYLIPMISRGHFTIEVTHLASSKLESNNICTAREFTDLLDEIYKLAFAKNENDEYKYPRFIYGSNQLFNQCMIVHGYGKCDGKSGSEKYMAPPKVVTAVLESLRAIKLAAYNKIYPHIKQASTFHASGSSNDAPASFSDAASASDEFSPADGSEKASTANSAIKTNSSPDRKSSDSLATSEQSMPTSNPNSKSTVSSLTSAPRDADSMSTDELEAMVQKRKAEAKAKEEATNSAYLTQLSNIPDHLIHAHVRNQQLQQQQKALQSSSSALSASSES